MDKELRNCIKGLSKQELLSCVLDLCASSEDVREYFEFKVKDLPIKKTYSKEILKRHKKKIDYWFFIHHEFEADTERAWEVVEKFHKRHKDYPDFCIELIIHWIKAAVEYATGIRVEYEVYYDDITCMFKEALDIAKKNDLLTQYEKCFVELKDSTEHFGWCTYDIMEDMLKEFKNN